MGLFRLFIGILIEDCMYGLAVIFNLHHRISSQSDVIILEWRKPDFNGQIFHVPSLVFTT